MKLDVRKTTTQKKTTKSPTLALRPSVRKVAAGETIEVRVDFAARLGGVDLVVEPRGAFTLDLRALTRPGIVRMKGKKHGKATLIATAPGVRRLMHVECEGPKVGLSEFEYIPPAKKA
jgi:hypothetical protein